MKLVSQQHQQGVGLIEVLVALLILAVAILGFSAVQMGAMRTTDESVLRSRAMTVMRSGAETMRALSQDEIRMFETELQELKGEGKVEPYTKDCLKIGEPEESCNTSELVTYHAEVLHNYAVDNEVQIGLADCPIENTGTTTTGLVSQTRKCMIVSWGETTPDFGAEANTNCADANGIYYPRATCFIMEAY